VNNAKAKQNAVPCSKDGCNNKRSVENEYCKLHQLQVFIDETKAAGKKLCYNHNRGCRTQLDESYGYSKCQSCLGDERKKDNEKRNKIKNDNEKVVAPELRTEKGCTNCCKILPMEQFKSILPPHTETLNCISCRENNTKQDLKRDREHRNEIARKNDSKPERIEVKKQWKEDNYEKVAGYWMNSRQHKIERVGIEEYQKENAENAQNWRDNNPDKVKENNHDKINSLKLQYGVYMRSAELKNLEFAISFEEYTGIVKTSCYYCGIIQNRGTEQFNGIDREDNAIGYVKDNCVSCCKMCNFMKKSLSGKVFINRVEHILTFNKVADGRLFPELFADHDTMSYCKYKYSADKKNNDFKITKDDYETLISKNCYICGKHNSTTHKNGIDRYDNDIGYVIDNCRTCCGECNYMKREYSHNDVFDKFKEIYEHNNCKECSVILDIVIDMGLNAKPESICNKSVVISNKKQKQEIKEGRIIKKQNNEEAIISKYGNEEYKKIRAKEIAENRITSKQTYIQEVKNNKELIKESSVDIPIEECYVVIPIEESRTDIPTEESRIDTPIEEVKNEIVQKVKFQKKTQEQLKEDRRIRKQKQRETLKSKLGVEEYNKLRANEIAKNRESKKNVKP
jgi:hypothetical protein